MTEQMKKLYKESESWEWTVRTVHDLFLLDNVAVTNELKIIEEDIIDDIIDRGLDYIDIDDIALTVCMEYNLDIGRNVYRKVNELYKVRKGQCYMNTIVDYMKSKN